MKRASLFAVFAALGLVLTGLSQCRMVTVPDNAASSTQLSVEADNQRSKCRHVCDRKWAKDKRAEEKRYRRAYRACHGDRACQVAAHDTHEANEDVLAATRKACKNGCYNEGAVSGGR